jgi:GR25 family glycosyltransferase involved in LPS biosynthesis
VESIVITMRGSNRMSRIQKHFEESGVDNYRFFYGVDGPKSKLATTVSYEIDKPDSKLFLHPKSLGCFLSHWMLWSALDFCKDTPDAVQIFEDDVLLRPRWKETVERALTKLPEDWDILFPGSCCAGDKRKKEYDSNLFEGFPLCTHHYIVRKKALKTLIESNEEVCQPIDIQSYYRSGPLLQSFIIFPRVSDQVDTVFPD